MFFKHSLFTISHVIIVIIPDEDRNVVQIIMNSK